MDRLIGLLLLSLALAARADAWVTDDLGRRVALDRPARRIVALSPHLVEMTIAAGAAAALVGITYYPELPSNLNHLPAVGGAGGVDRERLLTLQPDLVLGWATGNRAADLRWLDRQGIPLFLSEPESLDAIAGNIERIGILAGKQEQAQAAAANWRERLRQSCAESPIRPQQVFYQVWPAPLMTIGGRHWLNEVLARAGMSNQFAAVDRHIVTIGPEAVVSAQPDFQLSSMSGPALDQIPFLIVPASLARPGPHILDGLSQLCAQLPVQKQH